MTELEVAMAERGGQSSRKKLRKRRALKELMARQMSGSQNKMTKGLIHGLLAARSKDG